MEKKLVSNYLYSTIYQLFLVLIPIITVPYTTRVLGSTPLGINTLSASIVQWFVIFGIMGINMYGNREIARVRDNKEKLSKTFFEIYLMQFINLCVMVVLYFIFLKFFKHHYFIEYRLIFFIQAITLISIMFDITWFFYGVEDFKKASIRNFIIKIINVLCIFTFIKGPEDLWLFVTVNTLSAVFGQAIMWVQLKQYIKFTKVSIKDAYKHFKPNMSLFVPQIAISVYVVLDQTMTGFLSNADNLAFYQQSQRFVKMFLLFVTSIGSVMLPRISNTFAKGENDKAMKYLSGTFKLALYLSIPMMFGMMAVAPNFISWYLAEAFAPVGPLISITAPIIVLISISNVFGVQYMIPAGMSKQYSKSVIFGAITNLIMNAILIPMFGAYGAAIGSIGAELVVTVTQWLSVRNNLELNVKFKSVMIYVFSGILMFVAVYLIGYFQSANFIVNIEQVLAGAIIYMGMLTITRDEFHISIIKKILRR